MRHIHDLVPCMRAGVAVFDFTSDETMRVVMCNKAEEELAQLQPQNVYLREEALKSEYNFGEIISASEVMQSVF